MSVPNQRAERSTSMQPGSFKAGFVIGKNLKVDLGLENCPIINSAAKIAASFEDMKKFEQEVMVAGAVDCKCRLLFWNLIALGTSNRLVMRVGDVFCGAVSTHASAVFIAHNHPSGSVYPSKADFDLTRDVAEAGLLFGYPLLDHVVIASNGDFLSLMTQATLKHRNNAWRITSASLREASDGSSVNVAWRCAGCGKRNTTCTMYGIQTNEKECCKPACCIGCRGFTWLTMAK